MSAGLGSDLITMIEPVLESMGYGLVDVEFGSGGLLRVTIDIADGSRHVQIEDCEAVSHQLGRVFMVEDVDYDRLEVSSPGLDRPLRKDSDFVRFCGERLSLRLRQPVAGRRSFSGVLLPVDEARRRVAAQAAAVAQAAEAAAAAAAEGVVVRGRRKPVEAVTAVPDVIAGEATAGQPAWVLIWQDDPEPDGRRPAGTKGKAAPRARPKATRKAGGQTGQEGDGDHVPQGHWLTLSLDQIEKARLVPKLAF